jgi:hypothetical protein
MDPHDDPDNELSPEFLDAERRFLEERYKVSDEELLARVLAAPDMGGAMLVKLNEFALSRVLKGPHADMDAVIESIHANPAFSVEAVAKAVDEAMKKQP